MIAKRIEAVQSVGTDLEGTEAKMCPIQMVFFLLLYTALFKNRVAFLFLLIIVLTLLLYKLFLIKALFGY